MIKKIALFISAAIFIFAADQYIKDIIIEGFRYDTKCISIVYTLNKGVAFSMFSFMGEYLKFIQITIIAAALVYVLWERLFSIYYLPVAVLLGAAASNIYDRFIYGGVVDYVAWHCWFDFAVFNFADVMIDFAVVLILIISFKRSRKESSG